MSALPYDAPVVTATGESTTLEQYRGKAILIVNVASKCGFTPQYAQLEKLAAEYGSRGLVVLGFPCNQFARQEPGSNEQIAEFCSINYGVTFPIFGKVAVNGTKRHAIFDALRSTPDAGGSAGKVRWNFEKFLIAPNGDAVARFRSRTVPDAPEVIAAIEAVLPN